MSIATLARKSRAQRGASTRTGWTLATTKSGNCPGPCGGGAPAKQHSFRRLMKNKARPGRERSMTCGGGYQRVNGDWVKHTNADPPDSPTGLIGQSFTQPATGVSYRGRGYNQWSRLWYFSTRQMGIRKLPSSSPSSVQMRRRLLPTSGDMEKNLRPQRGSP